MPNISDSNDNTGFTGGNIDPKLFNDAMLDSYRNRKVKAVPTSKQEPTDELESAIRRCAQQNGMSVTVRKFDSSGNRSYEDATTAEVRFQGKDRKQRSQSQQSQSQQSQSQQSSK